MLLKLVILNTFLGFALGSVLFTKDTPLLGRALVANFNLSNATAIRQAKDAFPSMISDLFEGGVLDPDNMTFSVDVFSAATNQSIYSYTHVGSNERASLTAGRLNDETVTRIGSVSKLFTVYALMAKLGIDAMNRRVTDYLPELLPQNGTRSFERIRFEDLTIGALASQQGGTGGAVEAIALRKEMEKITPEELFQHMTSTTKHPVIAPYERSMYSDGGFLLLTQIIERVSGLNYTDAIQSILSEALGLEGTSAVAPKGDDVDIINRKLIDDASLWGVDIPIVAGSGGVYSSRKDLRTLCLSILNSQLLTPSETRRWMKPLSGTGSLVEMVGAPWEIYRLAVPVTPDSNRTRVSDLYTKAGGSNDYTAVVALSPDHGLGFSVLVAGPPRWAGPGRFVLRNALGEVFIPAAEWAAVENAERNIIGTFVGEISSTANLTLSLDKDGAGLVLDSVYVHDLDARWVVAGYPSPQPINGTFRLYPTDINSQSSALSSLYTPGFTGSISHRLVVPQEDARSAVEGGSGMFEKSFAWANVGFFGVLDEFVLGFDCGRLVSVWSPGLETTFRRAD